MDLNLLFYDNNQKSLPILDIGNKQGFTDYIDFIKPDEVKYPVMQGIDCFRRKFIVLKMIVNKKQFFQTFFQRYTNGSSWMGCGHYGRNLIDTSGNMSDEQFKLLYDIIQENEVKLNYNHRLIDDALIGKNVYLYKGKKWKAIKIIENQWFESRWNPKYKICNEITWRKHQEIVNQYELVKN